MSQSDHFLLGTFAFMTAGAACSLPAPNPLSDMGEAVSNRILLNS